MIITKYLFPISSPIFFLPKYGFYFDNPRTSEEINWLEQKLRSEIPDGKSVLSIFDMKDVDPHPYSLDSLVDGIFKHLPKEDPYVTQFMKKYQDNDPFNTLARMWVLVKIDKGKAEYFEQLYRVKEQSEKLIKMHVQTFNPMEFLQCKLFEFVQLSSLTTSRYKYWDKDTFLMTDAPYKPIPNLGGVLFAYSLIACFSPKATEGMRNLTWFHEDFNTLIDVFNIIENELNSDDRELIEYLASLIYSSAHHILTEKARLLLLVSIIELMLTHSPDYSRFNIEDSISKQFQLKTSLIVYQNDKNQDINEIRDNLKNIYHVRSKIAHGDFKSLRKFIQNKLSTNEYRDDVEDIYLEGLNELLYIYIKAIIMEYFKDKKYVMFIKQN